MNLEVFPPLHSEPAGEYAYRVLRKNILFANLLPGECLSPAEVGRALDISRTPVQTAFTRLTAEGLLHIFPQCGSFVSLINMERVYQSTAIRLLLEQDAMRVLCERGIPQEGLTRLGANLIQQNFSFEKQKPCEVFELDEDFHRILFSLAGMELSQKAIENISADQSRVRLLKLYARLRWGPTLEEHRGLIEALQSRDVEAGISRCFTHIGRISLDLETIHAAHPEYFEKWETAQWVPEDLPRKFYCMRGGLTQADGAT